MQKQQVLVPLRALVAVAACLVHAQRRRVGDEEAGRGEGLESPQTSVDISGMNVLANLAASLTQLGRRPILHLQ